MLNKAEIPSVAQIRMHAECGDCETVGAVKQNRYMCRGWRLKQSGPWSSLCSHGYYVFTLVVWLCISLVVNPGTIKFWLLSQISTGRLRSKIRILTKVFCISDPNLVILAWTGDEFLRGQTQGSHTHMDRQMQAMTITKAQIWPRIKITLQHWDGTYSRNTSS